LTIDGAELRQPGELTRRFSSLAELVRSAPDLEGNFRVVAPRDEVSPPGKGVVIRPGEIPLIELIRFLSEYTGLPVVHNLSRGELERTITVPSEVTRASAALVQRMLEAQGIGVRERILLGGERALAIDSDSGDRDASLVEPRPLIVADRDEPEPSDPMGPPRLARGPEPRPAEWLGFVLGSVPPEVQAHVDLREGWGVFVRSVPEERDRKKSWLPPLEPYDIITQVDDDLVTSLEAFAEALDDAQPGAVVRFRILRGGWTRIVTARKPSDENRK
jgi:hypothetical protein